MMSVAIGLVAGLPLALGAARAAGGLLFGERRPRSTFISSVQRSLLSVAGLAAVIPHGARVPPIPQKYCAARSWPPSMPSTAAFDYALDARRRIRGFGGIDGTRAADGVTRRTFLSSGLTAAGLACRGGTRDAAILSAGCTGERGRRVPEGLSLGRRDRRAPGRGQQHQQRPVGARAHEAVDVRRAVGRRLRQLPSLPRRHRARRRVSGSTPTGSRSSGRASSRSRAVYSIAELDHYRRVLAACHEHGLTPMVTFWHFTSPALVRGARRLGEPGDRAISSSATASAQRSTSAI